MVDRTRLKEALDRFLAREPEIAFDLHDELRVIVAAARAVVEAPEWEVCEVHGSKASGHPSACVYAVVVGIDAIRNCRMVRVFLVPAEEES
jgi:hypothetical protein